MDDAEKKMDEELAKIAEATIPRRYDDKKKKQLAVSVFSLSSSLESRLLSSSFGAG